MRLALALLATVAMYRPQWIATLEGHIGRRLAPEELPTACREWTP